MGKTTQSRHIVRLSQLKLVLEIEQDQHFHDKVLQSLNNKKHVIHHLCTSQAIKRLQVFLKQQLNRELAILEDYFVSEPRVSLQQKTDCDNRLMKLLQIIKLLYKNDDFYQEDDKNLPTFNKIMSITDNFEVQAKMISLLMNTSFQKTQKEFFYNIYFLCDHIDIHDLKDSGIKDVYELGKTIKSFRFYFIQDSCEKQIVIEDFYRFLWENQLNQQNYITVTDFVLKKFQFTLQKHSMTHLALLSKVKLYMKAVKFDVDGAVTNNANQIVQAISYANAMYCYIEYFVLGQQITDHISIPNIFSFPPAYSQIFKELLELFLLESSNKQTHLIIMKAINQILEIQEKASSVDIVGRLNDNSSLIYKYLSVAKSYLANESESMFTPSRKQKINLEAVKESQFMLELFKIMATQIQQTHELNSIACGIIEKIFRKQAICQFNEEVISEAGNLLIMVEYEEEKLVKTIIEKVENDPSKSKPYLRVLNDFFSKKVLHRMIQRRDLTYVARESSESSILTKMQDLIKIQVETGNIERDSFLMETIQLISNVCEQSPTLIDSIQKTTPNLLPILFKIIASAEHIPADIQSLTDVINFMHHVSLIDGPIRNTMLKKPMVAYLTKLLFMDKFTETLTRSVKSIGGYIVGSLSRLLGNISVCGQYIFNAFISAALMLNQQYNLCSFQKIVSDIDLSGQNYEDARVNLPQKSIVRLLRCDAKLINLLKLIERTSSMVLKKFKSRSLYMLLRPLLQIAVQRDNVFVDGSLEHSLLKLVINQTISAIKIYNEIMVEREGALELEKTLQPQNLILESISQENLQSGQSSLHVQQQEQSQQPEQQNPLRHQRLITQNSESLQQQPSNGQNPPQNPIIDENIENSQQQQQHNPQQNQQNQQNNEPANSDQQARMLFEQMIREGSQEEGQEVQQFEEVFEIKPSELQSKKESQDSKMEEEPQNHSLQHSVKEAFGGEKQFFKQLTWKKTKELVENYQSLPESIVEKLYECYENLDKLILPLVQNSSEEGKTLRQKVINQISSNSLMDEVERQTIEQYKNKTNNSTNSRTFSFNSLNLAITIYSCKLERIFKLMQFTINFDNPEFNFAEFENVIEKYDNYLVFYLEIVSQTNARNIFTFIQSDEVKFIESSKLPKSRVDNKTMDVENLRRSLQVELNEKWTLFNVLFDSFLRLVSGSLSSPISKKFLEKPQGFQYFQLISSTVLATIQKYLVEKIIPKLRNPDITVQEFQMYRQAMKVVMQIFLLNEARTGQKVKTESNLLITLYLYNQDFDKENIVDILAKLASEQQETNPEEDQSSYQDNKENRWKYIKKVFLKMTFFKIKHFLTQGFLEQVEPAQMRQNTQEHPNYQKQMKKNYFVFSRIHKMICTFLKSMLFCQNKNGYVRDLLLFNASQFSHFSTRITMHKNTIFYNYVFQDNEAKQLSEDEFISQVNRRNIELLTKLTENMDKSVFHYLPMVLKAIYEVERPDNDRLMGKFNEKIRDRFYQISRRVNQIYYALTNCNLDFGFSMPRKRTSMGSTSLLPKISEQINEEIDQEPELDLKKQVLKMNNLLAFVIEFIKYFKNNEFFEQGHPKITSNYIKSIVEFGSFLLSNFQVEKHFPQQGDEMVSAITRMVEEFTLYKEAKQKFIKDKRALRQKQRHQEKKKKFKRTKKRDRDQLSDSISNNTNQISQASASQNAPSKTSNKQKQRTKGENKKKKLSRKTAKREKLEEPSTKTKEKKFALKEQAQSSLQQFQPKGSILNRVVTDFIKISLTASHERPYLYARTVQLILNFLQKFSKDIVLRSESDIANIKSGKNFKKYKNKFFVFGAEIFGDLLKVKLKNQKFEGFFYLLTYLGMKLMTEPHVKVDFECAIKRIFFEHQQKVQTMPFTSTSKDRYRIKISQFQEYIDQEKLRDLPDLSYLLTIIEEKKKPIDQIVGKQSPFRKKRDQNYIEESHQFTNKNFQKLFHSSGNNSIYVKLKGSQELDVISLPSIKRKKPAHGQDVNKKVRFFEYHPEGDFAALICQIINHIVKTVVKQMVETLDRASNQSPDAKEHINVFNLKILIYSLQVLSRQSPTIVPWIARFKCKKLLINQIKSYGLQPNSEAYRKIASYVYGNSDALIQNFNEVSFLTLLVKLIYPVSQISTLLFQLCLDNNVLIQDKSQKAKEQKQSKEQPQEQIRKCQSFGSIIRHKIISEIQNELNFNKNIDESYIKSGFDAKKQSSMIVKKVSCMGLLTILMSIREFGKICIENNLLRRLQEEYMRTSTIVRAISNSNCQTQLSLSSSTMRNFLINYFLRPMEILQQLAIQYHIAKKQSQTRFLQQFTNHNRVHIRFLLTSDTINDQLFGNDIFFKSKFKTEWFYANNLQGDEAVDFDEDIDERSRSIDGGSENGYGLFDDEVSSDDDRPELDQQIEEEAEDQRSLSLSGEQILSEPEQAQDDDEESEANLLYGSQDPFDRDSNTFENFILYPNEDHVIEDDDDDQDDEESIDGSESEDMDDDDMIDSYDDESENGDDGLQIELQPEDANLLFPIENSDTPPIPEFWSHNIPGITITSTSIVPQVGIYQYFIPYEPERRDHPNHVCNNSTRPEIKQLQNLYEIFMDVVSFENIVITNSMVKLQNQQAKVIRKVFKVISYKRSKGTKIFHNQHIFELEEEYYNQLYQIFTLDKLFFVSERIDFRECQKQAHFLQSLPIHYIDMYMDESEIYFNEITKPLRGRRRGMFFNQHMMDRIRRRDAYRNVMNPFREIPHHRGRVARHPDPFLASESSSENPSPQQNPQLPGGVEEEGEQNQAMNRIELNIENPNGGVVNFHADLDQILANIGMSEREFLNLPHDVQSDIIQNSLQSQLQNGDGNLNLILNQFGRNDHQAPNVSPQMMPYPAEQIDEENNEIQHQQNSEVVEEQIQMPESFDMAQENQENIANQDQAMEEQHPDQHQQPDTPINQINVDNDNFENVEEEVLPERYRKISLQHSQKISKDIIEILNKDHKNDSKFPEVSQDLLQEIIESIFVLECKDFCRFPYSFLSLNMINSKSCLKTLSSLMSLLCLYPESSQLSSLIEGNQHGIAEIKAKKRPDDLIPKLSLRTYLYETSKDYQNQIYPNISIKILHILQNLTKNYSISMQMLKLNNTPIKTLEKYVHLESKEENFLSSFQTLIRLLNSETVLKAPVMVQQILRITNNVVSHYFEKNIFSIHQQQKQLKEGKKNPVQPVIQHGQNKTQMQNQGQVNILPVSLQKKDEVVTSNEVHKAIELSQFSIELLCSLLMSDELRESQNLSELIMKLSINGKNLIYFIKNIQTVLEKLCQRSIVFLNKQKQIDEEKKRKGLSGSQVEQTQIDDLMKVFCLLEIFSSMIKEFKQFAYRHHIDRYDFIMSKFRNIIESKSLFALCETIASIISTTGEGNQLIKSIPEIFQIFFVVFSINIELQSKNGVEDKTVIEQKQANKIASLGQINQKHKNSSSKKLSNSNVSSDIFLIQNAAFNKLWNDKMCSPNGRLLLNLTIKRKLSTLLKRKRQIQSTSLFDLPMIKIIMNSPHLLDFDNKRALFRAQMKRLKRKKSQDRVIYMSLDRKEVFQQSFNIIMDKKPDELKNRVKIDFEGEQGQDAGGLTRQWYQLLSTEMFNPNYGLFRPSSTGNTYQPSSTSYVNSEHLNYFKFIGRIMGKALFDGFMLDAYFTPAFYKHILKIPITYLDMEEEDYEYFNSLKWILDNSPIEDYMDLDFTYEFDNFGELKTKELIPNGQKVKVTQENKWQYVQLICYAKMATAVQAQLQMFLQGLHQIVPHKYLKIFDPKELEIMISGLPTIDIADLKRNTELVNYIKTDQIIMWLFEVLENFDMSLRTSFLQFVTGTSKVPAEGFKGLNGLNGPQKFTIQKEFDIKKLPRAHTCFNQLDLPAYSTKEMLIEKLTYAITEGKEGFGIA